MDDEHSAKLDIFEPKNIAKILLCAIFVTSVLYIMIRKIDGIRKENE